MSAHAIGKRRAARGGTEVRAQDAAQFLTSLVANKLSSKPTRLQLRPGNNRRKRVQNVVFGSLDNICGKLGRFSREDVVTEPLDDLLRHVQPPGLAFGVVSFRQAEGF